MSADGATGRALYRLREQYRTYLEEGSGVHEYAQAHPGPEWSQVLVRERAIALMHRQMCADLAWIISGEVRSLPDSWDEILRLSECCTPDTCGAMHSDGTDHGTEPAGKIAAPQRPGERENQHGVTRDTRGHH